MSKKVLIWAIGFVERETGEMRIFVNTKKWVARKKLI